MTGNILFIQFLRCSPLGRSCGHRDWTACRTVSLDCVQYCFKNLVRNGSEVLKLAEVDSGHIPEH